VRMLLPSPADDLTDDDIDEAYAWPGWPDARPWLRANMVSTVDGAGRGPSGLSGSISGEADKRVFGRLRGLADVVLVGAGTARAEGYRAPREKPSFADRRRDAGQAPVPAIALVTRSLHLDLTSELFTSVLVPTVVVTSASSDPALRAQVAEVADVVVAGDDDVDLVAAVAALHERGLSRIHCEGGPTLLADVAAAGLLDELCLTVSPLLAGGSYAGEEHAVPRILASAALPQPPAGLALGHVLEDDGTLFLRYTRR
jgi:riboflavin biosynthesis pyrimidine reductase